MQEKIVIKSFDKICHRRSFNSIIVISMCIHTDSYRHFPIEKKCLLTFLHPKALSGSVFFRLLRKNCHSYENIYVDHIMAVSSKCVLLYQGEVVVGLHCHSPVKANNRYMLCLVSVSLGKLIFLYGQVYHFPTPKRSLLRAPSQV